MCVQQGPLCMLACLRLKEESNSHKMISWQACFRRVTTTTTRSRTYELIKISFECCKAVKRTAVKINLKENAVRVDENNENNNKNKKKKVKVHRCSKMFSI